MSSRIVSLISTVEPVSHQYKSYNPSKSKICFNGEVYVKDGPSAVFNLNASYKKSLSTKLKKAIGKNVDVPLFNKDEPVEAVYTIAFPSSKKCQYKPDSDNLAKTFSDAAIGIIYKDDCQITSLKVNKILNDTDEWKVTLEFKEACVEEDRKYVD